MYCGGGIADDANWQQSKEEWGSKLRGTSGGNSAFWILVMVFPPCGNSEGVRKSVAIRYENLR